MLVTDRLSVLQSLADQFTGIDFVQIEEPCVQTVLKVYFLTDVEALVPPFDGAGASPLTLESFVIHAADGDPNVPPIPVIPLDEPSPGDLFDWGKDADTGRTFVRIRVAKAGDFIPYRLRIDDPRAVGATVSRIDPFFNDLEFSFKIGCDNDLDCEERRLECPPDPTVDFPVDYLARDFVSLRNALLDFAAQRYPKWTFPVEADVGTMVMELMAALGDELSYVQDRHAREAYLETATERRSLRKKARLLDFEIHDGRSASTFLEVKVKGKADLDEAVDVKGMLVLSPSESGPPVPFEVVNSLAERFDPLVTYPVKMRWNAELPDGTRSPDLTPHVFDDDRVCLPPGTTEMFIENHLDVTALEDADGKIARPLLLRTEPTDPVKPRRRHLVHLAKVEFLNDPLFGKDVTRLVWDRADALPFGIDQQELFLSLNIVPATGGETAVVLFTCGEGEGADANLARSVEREGALPADGGDRPTIFLFSLPGTEQAGLGFVGEDLRATGPEIRLEQVDSNEWKFRRSLLGEAGAGEVFTLEDGTWRRIIAFRTGGEEFVQSDYASGAGYTIRFGDGVFGKPPARPTKFRATYRLGTGARGNVPEGTINLLNGGDPRAPFIAFVRNPFDVTSGVDPEAASDIRKLVPEGYRENLRFAVRPEDYGAQAEKLDFVQRAFGKFRWTGSWQSAWVAADPIGSFTLTDAQREALRDWLGCVRQAGREVIVKSPRTLGIDLEIEICVETFAYRAQVKERVLEVLFGRGGIRPVKGFFDPDNFTFGTPLRRSALEAAIQGVPGVRAVLGMRVRERGVLDFRDFDELVLEIDADAVIRVENDARRPERGRVDLIMEGGA